MDYLEIERILDRFWIGESSSSEEDILYAYFTGSNIDDSLAESKDYFLYLYNQRSENGLGLDFDQKVLSRIKSKKKKSFGLFMRVAAGFLILFACFQFMRNIEAPDNPTIIAEDTYENPEEAYQEVKKALFLLSGEMNKGKSYGGELKKFSKAKKEIKSNKKLKIQK